MILTESGWKMLEDAEIGENVLTLVPHTKEIEVNSIISKSVYEYDGDIIHLKSRNFDVLMPPNHKIPLWNRKYQYEGNFTVQDIYENNNDIFKHSHILKTGIWNKQGDDYFVIPKIGSDLPLNKRNFMEKYSNDLVLPIKPFMAFMGIYLAEGNVRTRSKSQREYGIYIHQKKESVIIQIRDMFIELGLPFTEEKKTNGNLSFRISDPRLHAYLSKFGNCYMKYIPYEIKNQSKELLTIFYKWFVLGDGRKRGRDKHNYTSDDVFSTSKQLTLDLNEIQLKIGYSGTFHEENRKYDRYIKESDGSKRLIKRENCHNMFFTYRSLNKFISTSPINISTEKYKGNMICITVKNGIWYCMSNGKPYWTMDII
jgi:hypothetical protein